MNWFEKHLNWTYVLGNFLSGIFVGLVLILSVLLVSNLLALFVIILYITWIIFGIVLAGWVLKRKSQSLWWLLTFLIFVGGIVVLVLENRSRKR